MDIDWKVFGKSLLWLLAAFYVLGTPIWPLSLVVGGFWLRWLIKGSRTEGPAGLAEGD